MRVLLTSFSLLFLFPRLSFSFDWGQLEKWKAAGEMHLAEREILSQWADEPPQEETVKAVVWYLKNAPTYPKAWEWAQKWQNRSFPKSSLQEIYETLLHYALLASDWEGYGRLSELYGFEQDQDLWAFHTGDLNPFDFSENLEPKKILLGLLNLYHRKEWQALLDFIQKIPADAEVKRAMILYLERGARRGLGHYEKAELLENRLWAEFPQSPEALLIKGPMRFWYRPTSGVVIADKATVFLQTGAYRNSENAQIRRGELQSAGWGAEVQQVGEIFFVLISSQNSLEDLKKLKSQGFDAFVRNP